jgi:hypothetical protein
MMALRNRPYNKKMIEILKLWRDKLISGEKYYTEKNNFFKFLVKEWIIKE